MDAATAVGEIRSEHGHWVYWALGTGTVVHCALGRRKHHLPAGDLLPGSKIPRILNLPYLAQDNARHSNHQAFYPNEDSTVQFLEER